jgi:peptidoglycan/LPS O-acetylase OafA/YrhL
VQIPKYIPQFDYLRGIAVLLVMLFHASHDIQAFPMAQCVSFGWAGVDLFFVLSGFLISGILLDTRDQKRYFVNFYARRILRIWPLYFALLAVMFLAVPVVAPRWSAAAIGNAKPVYAFVLFIQNLTVGHAITGPLSATWSLAIEEQFYFVWPLLIWLLPRKAMMRLAAAVVIASPLLRLGLVLGQVHIAMYYNTFTRLDGLALGSFLAIWLRDTEAATVKRWAIVILPAAVAGSILLDQNWIRYSAVAIAAGAIVSLSLFFIPRSRFILYTGRISFGLYLTHEAVFGLATKPELRRHYPHSPVVNDVAYLVAGLVLSYAVASLSWFLFESQILRAKKWFTASSVASELGPLQELAQPATAPNESVVVGVNPLGKPVPAAVATDLQLEGELSIGG